MNDFPETKLVALIERHGRNVVSDPDRCGALMRDYITENRREVSILIGTLTEGLPADMLRSSWVDAATSVKRLQENLGYSEDAARWCVDLWIRVLGLTRQPATPPAVRQSVSNPAPAAGKAIVAAQATPDIEKWIRYAWIAGLVAAGYLLLFSIGQFSGVGLPDWVYIGALANSVAIAGMAFAVLHRGRVPAVALLSHHFLIVLIQWLQFPSDGLWFLHKLGILAFLFFYGKGVQAAFAYHDLEIRRSG